MWYDESEVEKFIFFLFFGIFLLEHYLSFNLVKTPWQLGSWFLRNSILSNCKTMKNKRNDLLCLALSLNWYLRVPTYFAWLHYTYWIFCWFCWDIIYLNLYQSCILVSTKYQEQFHLTQLNSYSISHQRSTIVSLQFVTLYATATSIPFKILYCD